MLPPESAGFLRLLVCAAAPRTILEIGTNLGFSGIAMLKASTAELYTIEVNEDTAKCAKQNFAHAGVLQRVHVFVGRAEEILPYMKDQFDFIFLDGPKGQYSELSAYLLPLLASGGMLVCDDVLFRGMVTGDRRIKKRKRTLVKKLDTFLHDLCADDTLVTSVLPIGDGMSVSYKRR